MINTDAFRNLSYGVYVVSTKDGERPTGCVANSVMQITSSPATIAVSMNHDNYTNSCIQKSGMFAVSILTEMSDPGLIGKFGFQSGRDADKFKDVDFSWQEGMPVLSDSCAYVVCKVIDKMETTTHTVFLGEVVAADALKKDTPMTYAYYHNVIKGKSPKNAPTYIEEKQDGKWVCSVCGYVYEGSIPFEELPDNIVCPLCKQPKSKFEYRV